MTRITGTLHEDQYRSLTISPSVLLIMRNISDKFIEKTHILCSITFFFENRSLCEIMWKYIVEAERPQTTMLRTRFACWITKATNTHPEYVIPLFHCNNGCTNTTQYYLTRTMLVLFYNYFNEFSINMPTSKNLSHHNYYCES
jgi:hypothetical protein